METTITLDIEWLNLVQKNSLFQTLGNWPDSEYTIVWNEAIFWKNYKTVREVADRFLEIKNHINWYDTVNVFNFENDAEYFNYSQGDTWWKLTDLMVYIKYKKSDLWLNIDFLKNDNSVFNISDILLIEYFSLPLNFWANHESEYWIWKDKIVKTKEHIDRENKIIEIINSNTVSWKKRKIIIHGKPYKYWLKKDFKFIKSIKVNIIMYGEIIEKEIYFYAHKNWNKLVFMQQLSTNFTEESWDKIKKEVSISFSEN